MSKSASRMKAVSVVGLLVCTLGLSSFAVAARSPDVRPTIIGGTEVSKGKYPFMASLQMGKRHFCGGALLNAHTVVTAAHCVRFIKTAALADQVSVTVGQTLLSDETGYQRRGIDAVDVSTIPGSDLAALFLDRPVVDVVPVALPTMGSDAFYQPGQLATVMGWGNTDTDLPNYPNRLREVSVPILSADECAAAYPDQTTYFCAGVRGKDSCQGDSGGPIIRTINGRVYQIGVVSFGKGCAEQGAPGAYVDISSDALWNSLDTVWERPRSK